MAEDMAVSDAGPPPPFGVPIFRAMWLANMTSNFGSLIQSVGAAWLMTTLSRSPIMVTLVQSSTTLPIMLLSLFAGAAMAFLVNALSYVGLIAVLARWRPIRPSASLPRESLGAATLSGLRYVAMSPHLRVVMTRSALFGIFASGASALMPLIARDLLHGRAGTYGLLSAAFGVGAVGGAMVTSRVRNLLSSEGVARVSASALAIGTVVVALSDFLPLTLLALVLAGAGWVVGLAAFNILVQMASPRWVVGRALACYQMCAFGAMAAGSWVIGVLAEHVGTAHTLLFIAAFQAANLLYGFVLPLEEVGALNLDPISQSFQPETAVPVSSRSGPVVIAITYRIAAPDVTAFLAAIR
jgi:hypothetical protein